MSAASDPPPFMPSGDDSPYHHGDEEMVCYCFHVPLHKIVNFIRRERPAKVSMISHCLGAGTGCGTCVWDIKDIWKRVMAECAAEDAKNGVSRAPTPVPQPQPPLPSTGLAADYFGRHSPAVDLGPVLPPTVVPNPALGFAVPPAPTSAPPTLATPITISTDRDPTRTPVRPPAMPIGPESTDLDYDLEPEPPTAPNPPSPAATVTAKPNSAAPREDSTT